MPGMSASLVDPDRVRLAESELAALRDESVGARDPLVDLLVLVAGGRAVDDDCRALERLDRLVGHLVPERFEVRGLVGIDGELRAAAHQVADLGALGRHRGPLVERDLVDAEVALEVGEEARSAARRSCPSRPRVRSLVMSASPVRPGFPGGRKDTLTRAISPTQGARLRAAHLEAFLFRGPAGNLEGLWKEPEGTRAGSAVFAHPHPLHGGTLHNKVVFRAAKALCRAPATASLRFNFRGVGRLAGPP